MKGDHSSLAVDCGEMECQKYCSKIEADSKFTLYNNILYQGSLLGSIKCDIQIFLP